MTTEPRARQQAAKHYKRGDEARWVAAFWCAQVVGKYEKDATIGLADDMGVKTDTVYNLAHAYDMYSKLREVEGFRYATRLARRMKTIYYSHFRALWKAQRDYNLTLEQVFDILVDVYQGEGEISSRDVDQHARERYGVTNYIKELKRLRNAASKALLNKRLARKDRGQLKRLIATLEKRIG